MPATLPVQTSVGVDAIAARAIITLGTDSYSPPLQTILELEIYPLWLTLC